MKNFFILKEVCLVTGIMIISLSVNCAQLTQTIRGRVLDKDLNTPIIGANVVVLNSNPILGSGTGISGEFFIKDVPIGRISLQITCIGYETSHFQNILLTSAKELVLDIYLQESIVKMEELVIHSGNMHGEVLNDLASVSARAFSVEETKRYAGSFNDPARMVSSFAGVMTAPEGENYIAVRGNSPRGNQWRLEGIEIPNPNHFSHEGATGGPINALNSAMLSNSDFFTGAFPAEYGNAFSGIFDMRLRMGNNQKREYSFSVGVLGTDITLEGPFSSKGNSSYLVNYRYSTLDLLDRLDIVNYEGVPKYQDLSFKIAFPTEKGGTFSLFGLMGKSELRHKMSSEEDVNKIISSFNTLSNLGVTGVNHCINLNKNTFLISNISVSENGAKYDEYNLGEMDELRLTSLINQTKYSLQSSSTLHARISERHKFSTGFVFTQYLYDFSAQSLDKNNDEMITEIDEDGSGGLGQIFGTWKFRMNERMTFTGGIHYLQNFMNSTYSIEPRAGFQFEFAPHQRFNFGFGIHSRMESLPTYLSAVTDHHGNSYQPNLGLGFPKSRHYVIGYENRLSPNLLLKLETYYQDLYEIPVENDPNSSFSMLNMSAWYGTRELVNKGTGYNYGIEFTLERYFVDSYYFMLTASLYDSKYKAMDGILRDTRFNGNYVGNLLFGKEFIFSRNVNKTKILGINGRLSLIGARRFSPIDLEASRAKGYTVEVEEEAFTLRGDDIFLPNISITYRINKKRTSQELKLDIQNITNNQGMVDQYYDSGTDKVEKINQLAILPVIMYTIEF